MSVEEVIQIILKNVFDYSTPPIENLNGDKSLKNRIYRGLIKRLPYKSKEIARGIVNQDGYYFSELGANPISRRFLKCCAKSGEIPSSIDLLQVGDGSMEVTGIMTTFSVSVPVIQSAVRNKCNFIITHEPTFYIHHDKDEKIRKTKQYAQKRKLLEDNKIAIWRFHDLCHIIQRDFIVDGVLRKTGYDAFVKDEFSKMPILERRTILSTIIQEMKDKLGAQALRLIGDPAMEVNRYSLAVGMPDSVSCMQFIEEADLDLLIIGEIHEWELGDFVKDSIAFGKQRALMVIGHQPSEMAGMEYFTEWIKQKMPEQSIIFQETENVIHNR